MITIRHDPLGIDDPYKRLRVERFPRDPEEGDAVQVGFRVDGEAREAWLELRGPDGSTRVAAAPLSDGTWAAWLPTLPAGVHDYGVHVRAASGEVASAGPFALPFAMRREARTIAEVTEATGGVDVRFAPLRDGGSERAPVVRLRFPRADVCTVVTDLAAEDDGASAGAPLEPSGGARPAREAADGVAPTVAREGAQVHVAAGDLVATVDLETRALRLRRAKAARSDRAAAEDAVDDAALGFDLTPRWLEHPDGSVLRIGATLTPARDAALYGLGERFTGPDLRGRVWDTRVYEEYKEQGARTYLPVPLLLSADGWGVFTEVDAPARYDLRGPRYGIEVEAERPSLTHHLILTDRPYGVTSAFTALTGAIALPPRWAYGPWMSANTWNSQQRAEEVVRRTRDEDVPATVIVLEAWSDESTFYVFNDASYTPRAGDDAPRLADFRFGGRWPDPKAMVDDFHAGGLRVVLWQIPVLKKLEAPHAQHDADEATMLERGFAIREADGTPYRNRGWWFTDALVLDVTNPEACAWWFAKRRYLFDQLGIDGLKTDGGEHLWGRGLRAHDGSRGVALVNTFAQRYVDAYHAFVREATGGDGLTFSRAGYTGAQRSPAHWAGDENSTWAGFRASILAGVSAGLAGVSLWGFDLGGFSGEIPTVELYLRSTQAACFAPIMQFHSELHGATECRDRTPWNIAERHGDPRALSVYRAYAKLRMRLQDLLAEEAEALAAEGLPLMRLPALAWPAEHDRLAADPFAYHLGRDLLVAPVLEKGAETREVLLPDGAWVDLWSGTRVHGGGTVLAPAPLHRIPVFVRADSPRLDRWLEAAAPFDADLAAGGRGARAGG